MCECVRLCMCGRVRVYVCMYVYMYVRVYVRVYLCLYVSICLYLYVHKTQILPLSYIRSHFLSNESSSNIWYSIHEIDTQGLKLMLQCRQPSEKRRFSSLKVKKKEKILKNSYWYVRVYVHALVSTGVHRCTGVSYYDHRQRVVVFSAKTLRET